MRSGLSALVPTAELLAVVVGNMTEAASVAARLASGEADAIPQSNDDLHAALRLALHEAGVVGPQGVDTSRAAELSVVCGVLSASTPPPVPPAIEPRIVFSAPSNVIDLPPQDRLEGLVLDVIRCARNDLVIGGAFWNDAGFQLLNDVVIPAVSSRHVNTNIIVHPPEIAHRASLLAWIEKLKEVGPVTVEWYSAPAHSMMHAKFVIADGTRGYLGTANLTSWGLGAHVEAGLELMPGQCRRFLRFLDTLRGAGLFSVTPPDANGTGRTSI
jgi:hypothetical protein